MLKDTANYEKVPQILVAALVVMRRVKRIWADTMPPEMAAEAMRRFSGDDLLALALCELEKIGALDNPTSDQVWMANRWLDVLVEWSFAEARQCGEPIVA
ncbi:MAG: hypothetical protein H0X24_00560 [Ktedonobacterales bacterium]|nr:hypothetical protein [Ktedonobacterales bacterium]